MIIARSFHFGDPLAEQKDVRFTVPIPTVYENVPVEPARWEYRILTVDIRENDVPDAAQLNELGNQGWLLVGILDQGATGQSSLVHYYFVRLRQ